LGFFPVSAIADDLITGQTNLYGTPGGLLDMPTAEMAPDGELSTTLSYFDGFSKATLTFQIAPRLSGSFRYSATDNLTPSFNTFYDRSFDLKFRAFDEGRFTPAIAIGLRDFVGTGVLAGEYIVATKSLGDKLRLTGGLGWGRLGTNGSIGSTGHRDPFSFAITGTGGKFNLDDWFRGDFAPFGGISYDMTDRLSFAVEYSSDDYVIERAAGIFNYNMPVNFSASYKFNDNIRARAFALNGGEYGLSVSIALNPKNAAYPGGIEEAPLPVAVREPARIADLGWTADNTTAERAIAVTDKSLKRIDLDLHGIEIEGTSAHILIRNDTYDAGSEALGRTLRTLSRTLPASVETLHVTLIQNGMPLSTITMKRRDLERLENAPAREALAAVQFQDSLRFGDIPAPRKDAFPRFDWAISPYLRYSLFDPGQPLRGNAGLRFTGDYHIGSGWIASGSVLAKVVGNLGDTSRLSNSKIARVRSDSALYDRRDEPVIDYLTLAKYGRLAPDIYSRVTGGYLEQMYAGASGEVLWKPVNSRLALGIEVNYVRPRDFNQLFGTRSRQTVSGTIPEFNGHISTYYDFGGGYIGQVDGGRYLAGDWGATLSLDREFANGWRVGAFATKTDVSAGSFGEGSFDKGIRITIPLAWMLGKPTKQSSSFMIRPLTRDGGQRLNVNGRLYETVRSGHQREIAKSWGKFWR
jgi:hypothetical protein